MVTKRQSATPGPWRAGRKDMQSYEIGTGAPFTNVYANAESDSPVVVAKCLGNDDLDDKANARLIAAAPEMLDVLADLYKEHSDAHPQSSVCRCPHWKNYRALLARVEGNP